MKLERLLGFRENAVSFDLEGHKIQPGLLAPPVICGSTARWSPATNRVEGRLLDLDDTRRVFLELLADPATIIVGANIAFDMLCMAVDFAARGADIMPQIFAAYEDGRVYDLQIAEALHAIANGHLGDDPRTGQRLRDPLTRKLGRYSLSICLDLVLHRVDAKVNDRFRLSYALLEGVPIASWPRDAQVYPVDDACNTLEIALAQVGLLERPSDHVWPDELDLEQVCLECRVPLGYGAEPPCPPRKRASDNLHDVSRQCYAAWSMHLGSAWGFSVDDAAVEALESRVNNSRADAVALFVALGYLREEHNRDRAIALLEREGLPAKWFRKKDTGGNLAPTDRDRLLLLLREGGAVEKVIRNTGAVKRAVALAYGACGACPTCAGTGKVRSAKSGNPVADRMCDGTGLNLDSAPVPRTKGSKCRTCGGARSYTTASKNNPGGPIVDCKQCAGQPDIVPGCTTGRDALYESGDDDVLIPFAEYLLEEKILITYLPFLKKGTTENGDTEIDTDSGEENDDAEDV